MNRALLARKVKQASQAQSAPLDSKDRLVSRGRKAPLVPKVRLGRWV